MREFWIWPTGITNIEESFENIPERERHRWLHVIEKSAYDELKAAYLASSEAMNKEIKELEAERDEEVRGLKEALEFIAKTGTGAGGAVVVTTQTLRNAAKDALAAWNKARGEK